MLKKVFVLTGATSGIGKALAMDLAKTGETLVLVARDTDRGNATLQEIRVASQNPNLYLQLCDLSILSSVRNLAEILRSKYPAIDALINNASVYKRKRVVTVDGFEEMFAANHLGPFLLTNLLLETLQAAVQTNGSARVLNITAPSTVSLNFDDLQGERSFSSLNTFGATKMANLLFTFELARRLENTGITVNAIHPGLTRSGIMREGSFLVRLLTRLFSSSPERVTGPIVQAVVGPEYEKTTGKFLHNGKEIDVPAYAQDLTARQRLWEVSESLTQLQLTKRRHADQRSPPRVRPFYEGELHMKMGVLGPGTERAAGSTSSTWETSRRRAGRRLSIVMGKALRGDEYRDDQRKNHEMTWRVYTRHFYLGGVQ